MDQWGGFSPVLPTLPLPSVPTTLKFIIPPNRVQNEIDSRSVAWIHEEAWLCSLADWNVGYRTGEKIFPNTLNSYDPLLTSSSQFKGVLFFYLFYEKHSCFHLEQLPHLFQLLLLSSSSLPSLVVHNSFIHSLNRYLLNSYHVLWMLFPFLL